MHSKDFLHDNIILRSDKQNSAQGSVFYVKQLAQSNGQEFVLKIYQNDDQKSYQLEKNVLEKISQISDTKGFPKLISTKEGPSTSEILIQALGPNLRSLQKQCPHRKFSKPTVFKIIIQIIERLKILHSLGYVHNDLKLENILVGHKDPDIVYLIDFGLTQTFMNEVTSLHNEKEYVRKFSGNFLFASLNSCRGNNKSRRDDIESVMYIMIYLLNDNYLPWCDIEKKYEQGMEFKDVLKERLEIEYTRRLFSMIPKELIQTLKTILTLKFDQEPDYDEIINALQRTLKNYIGHSPSVAFQFEWTVSMATKIQKMIQQENSKFEASECILDKNMLNFRSKLIGSGEGFSISPARLNNGVVYTSKMFIQLLESQDLGFRSPINFSQRARSLIPISNRSGQPAGNVFSDENDKHNLNPNFQQIKKSMNHEEIKHMDNSNNLHLVPLQRQNSPNVNQKISLAQLAFQSRSSSFKKPSQFSKGNMNLSYGMKFLSANKNNSGQQMVEDESDADSMSECKDENFETEEIDEIIMQHTFDVNNYQMPAQQMNIKLVGRQRRNLSYDAVAAAQNSSLKRRFENKPLNPILMTPNFHY